MGEHKTKILELVKEYTKEELAYMLIMAVESEIELLDNGCGNNLDFDYNLSHYVSLVDNGRLVLGG